ncbi:MAG: glycosyltransferase family 39 protein [Pseudomonadota bacterium]
MGNKLNIFKDVRVVSVVISLMISIWAVYQDSVINGDGLLYVYSAAQISEGNWQQAFSIYNWPFYSWLISLTNQLLGFSLESSAHQLNAVLTALAVVAFINLVKELGGDKKILIAGAITILIYPTLNDYRNYIIRDAGYIAFYLASIWLFIRYIKYNNWSDAVGWGTSMTIATLFRIEGSVFLALMPLIILFKNPDPVRKRLQLFLKAHTVLFVFILLGFVLWLVDGDLIHQRHGRLYEPVETLQNLFGYVTTDMANKVEVLRGSLLNKYSSEYAWVIICLSLLVIFITETITTLTPLFAVLAVYSVFRKLSFQDNFLRAVWYWLILLNVSILGVFLLKNTFLTGRFPLALSLTVMPAVPFALVSLFERWRENRHGFSVQRLGLLLIGIMLCFMALDGLISTGPSKEYIKDAGLWLKQTTKAQETLYSNNSALTHYAGKLGDTGYLYDYEWSDTFALLKGNQWKQYDYLAIQIKRKHPERANTVIDILGLQPVKTFTNSRGAKVLIFKTSDSSVESLG